MNKIHYTLAICRLLLFCLMMQATIQQAVALGSLNEPISLSSLLPLMATVYRNIPEAKNLLPEQNPSYLTSVAKHIDPTGHCHKYRFFASNDHDRSDNNDLDPVKKPLTHLLPAPFPLSIRYAEPGISVLFQDSIWLRLNQEESLALVPTEFPAVAKVSDMSDENWPQLITAESVYSNTAGVGSVFRWANQRLLKSFYDDPLLRFLAFIHGAAFHVQDTSGQLSYIFQHNGKLLSVSRFEAYLRFSLYNQSFLESLYPEIFGPSLPAGGGWHEWNHFIRKQPFHPPEQDANNRSAVQKPVNPEGRNDRRNDRSTGSEAHTMGHSERSSEQTPEPGTASTVRNRRQEQINQQRQYCHICTEPITRGSSDSDHSCPPAFMMNQKVAKKRRLQEVKEHCEPAIPAKKPRTFATASRSQSLSISQSLSKSLAETSGHIEQDKRTPQQITPSTPYPDTSGYRRVYTLMDNNIQRNYRARHANVPITVEPETVRIGNQNLMTLDTSQPFVDPALESHRSNWEEFNFDYLIDFLRKNNTIEYIVDIGCGGGQTSLLVQNVLNEQNFKIKVIPVDVYNYYDEEAVKSLPINIIAAQEIVGATPANTLFVAIHPFTGHYAESRELSRDITQGKTDYYITTLIKNNPGCFVLATEDRCASSPQRYIPPELVYTKHYQAFVYRISLETDGAKALRQAKATEMNSENGDIYRLNQLLAKLPEQRESYLASIATITAREQQRILRTPSKFWPDTIFKLHLNGNLFKEVGKTLRSIKREVKNNKLEMLCWHVYRQDINTSEVASQAVKEPPFSN
ncbi:hypothetical protein [Endozoicomonas sp. 8E]|uniref:hypothetical protein n=1 Tax=Endozoicomonas sp. 8E TaxID=3035692 RepID=UPI002938E080|nr:hypothetical protein [Endozoicomonas sp. 8E]WOG30035.1 hypothetical protein P6910_10385 [Endozoicomonas sp. 8E]